jgi:hypothetical protein
VLAGLAGLVLTAVSAPDRSQRASADQPPEAGPSAVTLSGTGEFSGLRVSVSQTKNLVNQVIRVSWTGGKPTAPLTGSFFSDYLQIMQCWGDDPAGPDREQCQFGGTLDGRGGNWTSTRQTSYGSSLVDPLETYKQVAGSNDQAVVPFHAVNGETTSAQRNQFFDAYSTNEVDYARTASDGTGQEFFEVETAKEASGLGCGERLTNGAGRKCWLAIVPRGSSEVDGKPIAQTPFQQVSSSPLSATNWSHRIVVPLGMQPIGLSCQIGSPERKLVGQESVEEAVSRWQPALCAGTGTIYGFSRVSDQLARSQLASTDPGMVLLTRPLDAPASDALPVYAPVGLTGLTIAVNIDRQAAYSAPDDVKLRNGERLPSLNLTPRLVAKMLTQSYKRASAGPPEELGNNPGDLTHDPDFLQFNPEFKNLFYSAVTDITVPLGLSDSTRLLWQWLHSDAEADTFLMGKADPWGMRVNPYYAHMSLPRDDFPKSDPNCQTHTDGTPPLCTLDAHAYANDLHEAARGAARGDSLARGLYDVTAAPPQYKRNPPALSGSRAVLALADRATAARYSLVTASLRNAAGKFVAPTDGSLLAGLAAMRSSSNGVLLTDPSNKVARAYPLTSLTYAATVPARLSAVQARQYAAFLRYAVGAGQLAGEDPGQLPSGEVPLPKALRQLTLSVANRLLLPAARSTPPVVTGPPAPLTHAPRPAVVPPTRVSSLPTSVPAPTIVPEPVNIAPVPSSQPTPTLGVGVARTPTLAASSSRFVPLLLLLLGAGALLGGQLLRGAPTLPFMRREGKA